jgi:hypothetical protein
VHIVTELLHGLDLYEWIELKLGGNGRRGESPVIPERHALVLAGQVRAKTIYINSSSQVQVRAKL